MIPEYGSKYPFHEPIIKSGKFHAGADFQCGQNVTIDVAEEVVIGDRCVIPDNAYLCGRRITIAEDFYGYSHWNKRLEIGLGRRDDEFATLDIGARCTAHDNKIDLAHHVHIGDDVGLSPEVAIYTHTYWGPEIAKYEPVSVGSRTLIGFRSVLLPGCGIAEDSVVGAGAVVTAGPHRSGVWAGNPATWRGHKTLPEPDVQRLAFQAVEDWVRSRSYRNLPSDHAMKWPELFFAGCTLNFESLSVADEESIHSDDLREFLFKRGFRFFTKRPFRKMQRIK